MLRSTCIFMDSRIAPINVHSISKALFTKHDSRNTKVSMFFLRKLFFKVPMLQYLCMETFIWCINYFCRTDNGEVLQISVLQHKSKFNFNLFWKENQILGIFQTLPLMYQILMLDWYWWSYSNFFYRGTDRQTRFQNPHIETCWHTKNSTQRLKARNLAVDCYMHPWMTGIHKYLTFLEVQHQKLHKKEKILKNSQYINYSVLKSVGPT